MKQILAVILVAIAASGCAYMRGTWLNPDCHGGSPSELPAYCHASYTYQNGGSR